MTEQSSQRSRRALSEGRRQLIVEAAAACFAEKGFHQTSVRDIASKAGISLGNLYNHFGGKHALIAEIATLEAGELETIQASLRESDQPLQALKRFLGAYLDFASRPENAVLAAEITAEAMRNPEIAERFHVNRARLVEAVETVLSDGVTRGCFNDGLRPDETAWQILDLLDGVAFRMAFLTKTAALRSRKAATDFIERAVAAVPEAVGSVP